jgi:uncharacterized protein (TIGR02444 family)
MLKLDGPHWQFSLRLYARDGVASACLHLQDAHGVDVNVLLIALHAGLECGRRVDAVGIATLDAAIGSQRKTLVLPLRTMRRLLKPLPFGPDSEPLRSAVKRAELAAEQFEQLCLARNAAALPAGSEHEPDEICWSVIKYFDPLAPRDSCSATGLSIATIAAATGSV